MMQCNERRNECSSHCCIAVEEKSSLKIIVQGIWGGNCPLPLLLPFYPQTGYQIAQLQNVSEVYMYENEYGYIEPV